MKARAWQAIALLVMAWLLLPSFTAVHVEGFSAQIQSLAMVLAERGSIDGHDVARPVVSEFIFFTRPGVVDLLALANGCFGDPGDLGFRVLTVLALAALVAGSAALAVRLARVRWTVALLGCVAIPGLVELGFYFNDNLVSAAFAAMAMATAVRWPGVAGSAVTGGLLGMAVLCRVDAVLAAPVVVLLRAAGGTASWRRAGLDVGIVSLFAAAVQLGGAVVNHGSMVDAAALIRMFGERHLAGHGRLPGLAPIRYFLGLWAPPLLLLGAWRLWRSRGRGWQGWAWVAALYVYPALIVLYVLRTTLEIRYFLPLIGPVLGVHVAMGLAAWGMAALAWARATAWQRAGVVALAAWVLAVGGVPPTWPDMRDGPRVLVGRLWTPVLWHRWQAAVERGQNAARDVAARLAEQRTAALVSTHWNDEFYVRLRLFELGYREVAPGPACHAVSRYRREADDRTVWHMRLDPQYGLPPFPERVSVALALAGAARCAPLWESRAFWLSAWGPVLPGMAANGVQDGWLPLPVAEVLWQTLDESGEAAFDARLMVPTLRAAPIGEGELRALTQAAEQRVAAAGIAVDDAMLRYERAFERRR